MKKLVLVANIKDLVPGKGLKIRVKKKSIALFRYNDNVYAVQNRCPHQNAELADGYIKEGKLYCSLHHWAFDISTGAYAFNREMKLQTYSVIIENNLIYVDINNR